MHGHEELACAEREMRAAVLAIKLFERNAAAALQARDLQLGAQREQRRREVAGERGMAVRPLRRDVTNVPAIFQAEPVGFAPPFALIVVDAARIETEIASERAQRAMAGSAALSQAFGGRIESYLTDPQQEPDPAKWETDIAYRLADTSTD